MKYEKLDDLGFDLDERQLLELVRKLEEDLENLSYYYQYLTIDGGDIYHDKAIELCETYNEGPWS